METFPLNNFLFRLSNVKQIAYDWSSSNWYLVDEEREAIYLCREEQGHPQLSCLDVVTVRLSKPTAIALDPSEGHVNIIDIM